MTADERAALRALAEKATPGPWEARGDSVCIDRSFVCHAARMYLIDRDRDAAYIAAANPAAIKALLTALDSAEAERARTIEDCANVCEAARARIWEYHDDAAKETASNVCTNLATEIRALAAKGE